MTINRKPTGRASSIPAGITMGVISAVIVLIAGSCITATLVNMEKLKTDHIGYAVLIVTLGSAWISAVISSKKIKRMKLMICMTSGICYFAMLIIVTGLMFGGQYSGVGETLLLVLCGSLLAYFSQFPNKNKRIKRIR